MTATSWMKPLPAAALIAARARPRCPRSAQTRTIAEIAAYQGPDRTQRLIAGAKKEGAVSVYGSTVAEDMRPVSDAFRKKYGIDFQYWRASSEQLVQRSVNENRAGRCAVDAFATVAAELETLHREKLLHRGQDAGSPPDLIPQALRPHGEWVATRLNIFSAAYNTNLVKKRRAPKSLRGPEGSALEGPSRGRGRRFRLVRHHRHEDGRGEGPPALPRHREDQRRLGAQGPHAARQPGRRPAKCRWRSRSTATSPSSRSATARRSSRSISRPVVALGYGPAVVALRTASACGAAVLRFHDRRRPGDHGQARHDADQSEDPAAAGGRRSRP